MNTPNLIIFFVYLLSIVNATCPAGHQSVVSTDFVTATTSVPGVGTSNTQGSQVTQAGTTMLQDNDIVEVQLTVNWAHSQVTFLPQVIIGGDWDSDNGNGQGSKCDESLTIHWADGSGSETLILDTTASAAAPMQWPNSHSGDDNDDKTCSNVAGCTPSLPDGSTGAVLAAQTYTVSTTDTVTGLILRRANSCSSTDPAEYIGLDSVEMCVYPPFPGYNPTVTAGGDTSGSTGNSLSLPSFTLGADDTTADYDLTVSVDSGNLIESGVSKTSVTSTGTVSELTALLGSLTVTSSVDAVVTVTVSLDDSITTDSDTATVTFTTVDTSTTLANEISSCPANKPIFCNDECKPNVNACQTSSVDVTCNSTHPVECDDGSCAETVLACTTDDAVTEDTCPSGKTYCWSSGSCRPATACSAVPACADPLFPKRCGSGSCVASTASCGASASCDPGHTLCEDGVCRDESVNECPSYNGCPLSAPVSCPNGDCLEEGESCDSSSSDCESGFVECWDKTCVAVGSEGDCDPPPYSKAPVDLALTQVTGSVEIPASDGSGAVMNLTIDPCYTESGGALSNRSIVISGVAESVYAKGPVRSPVLRVVVWDDSSSAPDSDVQFGNLLVGLDVGVAGSRRPGETSSDMCIAGLNEDDGTWTCIINSAVLEALREEGAGNCSTSVLSVEGGVRSYANSEEEVTEFSVFSEISEEDSGGEAEPEPLILPASIGEVIAVLVILGAALTAMIVQLYRSAKAEKVAAQRAKAIITAEAYRRTESKLNSSMSPSVMRLAVPSSASRPSSRKVRRSLAPVAPMAVGSPQSASPKSTPTLAWRDPSQQ